MPECCDPTMPASSVLLVECLSGLGAHEADAALRVRALRKAGLSVHVMLVEGTTAGERAQAISAAVARAVAEQPAVVCVVSPDAEWRAFDRALPASLPRQWWPSLVPGSGGEPEPGAATAPVSVASSTSYRTVALDCAPVRVARERGPVALWDGDFVLSPGPLKGVEGERLLRAYAEAIEERPELDLVILADPDPVMHEFAHSIGIGWRVHSAGESPREAEHTWIATASAVLLPLSEPATAGLVLRIMAAGVPMILDSSLHAARSLAAWLGATHAGVAPPEAALAAVLRRDPRVREASARARLRAAGHEPEALCARLALATGGEARRSREAA